MDEEDERQQQDAEQEQQEQQQQRRQMGQLVDPPPGERVHCCAACNSPIAIYGRLIPCFHTFCLACSTGMPKCFICETPIKRILRIPRPRPVFISAATLQSFPSEDELRTHTARLYAHISKTVAPELQQQQQQQ